MAKLTSKAVLHVAKLARLSLTKNEITKFSHQLSDVVDYFEQLNEVDTSGVLPTSQTTGLTNVLREDIIDETRVLTPEEAISGTDKEHNNYFVVPMLLAQKDN